MAGAQITVEIDDAAARASLDRLAKAGSDLTLAMKAIGETLVVSRARPDRPASPGRPRKPHGAHALVVHRP